MYEHVHCYAYFILKWTDRQIQRKKRENGVKETKVERLKQRQESNERFPARRSRTNETEKE